MGKSCRRGMVRRCACAFHDNWVRKVRNTFRESWLRIRSRISAKDGAQSTLNMVFPGTWEYDAVFQTLELYRDAPFGGIVKWGRDLRARSIKPFALNR